MLLQHLLHEAQGVPSVSMLERTDTGRSPVRKSLKRWTLSSTWYWHGIECPLMPFFPWHRIVSCAALLDVLERVDTSIQDLDSEQTSVSIDWFAWPRSVSLRANLPSDYLTTHVS